MRSTEAVLFDDSATWALPEAPTDLALSGLDIGFSTFLAAAGREELAHIGLCCLSRSADASCLTVPTRRTGPALCGLARPT
mmetsp:Transcript_69368/g.120187  ORF Transcript_69368/g.120187 Transcript_69368/m.120187 type:complete len:81 (+) Transcript_69368:550-792(+)